MKKFIFVLGLIFLSQIGVVSASTGLNISTAIRLGVIMGSVSIGAPSKMDFGQIQTLQQDQYIEIMPGTGEYFWVKDLKSSPAGFYTQISISDLTSSGGSKISASNVEIMLTGGVVLINGYQNTGVTVPDILTTGFHSLQYPLILLKRSTNSFGIVGQYGIKPILKIKIPKFQPAGVYSTTLLYTLIEN